MTTQPLHFPRRSFDVAPRAGREVQATGSTPTMDHAEVQRRRLAVSSLVLAFSIGAAAISYAVGALPV